MEVRTGLYQIKGPKVGFFKKIGLFFKHIIIRLLDLFLWQITIGALPFKLIRQGPEKEQDNCSASDFPFADRNVIMQPRDGKFNFPTAFSCLDLIAYAYNQYCIGSKEVPPNLSSPIALHWYEGPLEEMKLCGFIGISTNQRNNEKFLTLAIRGTETGPEWINNIDFLHTEVGFGNPDDTGNVSAGFWKVYAKAKNKKHPSLQDQIKKGIQEHLRQNPEIKQILITGHSLGAAVATLAAIDTELSFPSLRVAVYTVAAPRVGDPKFVEEVRKLNENRPVPEQLVFWRLYNTSDVVTELPLAVMPGGIHYQHVASGVDHENSISGWGIDVNRKSLLNNHSPTTYYNGLGRFIGKEN